VDRPEHRSGVAHSGVKGMKWGVRKKIPTAVEVHARAGRRVKTSGGKMQDASEDAIRVAVAKQKAKKSTTDSLSTKELRDMVDRMNLEQQYSRLGGGSRLEKGQRAIKNILGLGKTVNEAYSFANNSSMGKDLGTLLKK